VVASENWAKLYLMWDALRTGNTSGTIVRLMTSDDPETTDQALGSAAALIPQVGRCFAP